MVVRKVGIVSISDERPNANSRIKPVIQSQQCELLELLEHIGGVQPVTVDEPVNSPSAARKAGKYLAAQEVVATLFNVPTFGFPKFGVIISMFAPGPYMLVSRMDATQPSPAGIAGLGGAMTQLGIPHERLWKDLGDPAAKKQIEAFVSAAAVHGLKGSVLGIVGGRSMGLYPMVASSKEVTRKFGVDVDHVDQLEIVRRSETVDEGQVDQAIAWLTENAGDIQYDDILTKEKLRAQIRNYEALKAIIKEKEFDFTAVQCHYEMSEYQQPMCIAAMLSNDPYDWDGEKETHVLACEADEDGAMTMQILKLLSSGKPTCLLDTRFYDANSNTYLFQNCGIAPSWFAGGSCSAKENLKNVTFCSCVPKFRGGGAQADFWYSPGEYTLARLYQLEDAYHMLIMHGQAVSRETVPEMPTGEGHWPKVAMKMDVSPDKLVQKLNCVHMHAVAGDYVEALKLVCKYLNIIPEVMDE